MSEQRFEIAGLIPADLSHPGLALAVSRSGGIGVLDLVLATDEATVRSNVGRLNEATETQIGLRVDASHAGLASELMRQMPERSLLLILSAPASELDALYQSVSPRPQDTCLAEIIAAEDAATVSDQFSGLLLRGHEAGGWVGDDTSYILLQKVRQLVQRPLYVQGGIGVRAAAACKVAGAAGIVLDEALLLLAESPLSESQKQDLGRLNGAETRLLGELLGTPCRVYARPNSPQLKAAEALTREAEGGKMPLTQWHAELDALLRWQDDADALLPLGQGIGLAAGYRKTYRTVARLMQALRRSVQQQADLAAELNFINEGGSLAQSHGTRFPLCQGPMTRVSDSPDFAVEVAMGGALPFLALALMRGPQIAEMLEQTKAKIGNLPWGVGLLGFIPHALREEQCAEIWKCKPDFALIAGGRPDQAAEFEQRGIATYIHAPAPALLKMYIEQGARRFVFEGRECGGHIGPLASFPLWEQMIEVLLTEVPKSEASKIHVLFAGGIHDATSGAMVAAMAAPLAARGMKVGALMGTAYLFTPEIVSSGAVVEGFQQEALKCRRTMSLETGPGHATRCVDTKFAHDFYDTRKRLIGEGMSAEEIRDTLEDLNLGRLRIASKGVDRGDDGKIRQIEPDQQLTDGMYMIGQVATLRDEPISVENLHREVCCDGQALLDRLAAQHQARVAAAAPSDVAVVGVGVLLPKAKTAEDYWDVIVQKVSTLGEVPSSRWDWKQYFDADRKARDKVYSRWGGFLEEIAFDPMRFGIPPKSMKSIDPMQILTLEVASRALDDAGYHDGGFDRETTSVILGAGGGLGDLGLQYGVRAELPRFVGNVPDDAWERLPEWTEESFAGSLLNVAAGRVANRLDFGGVNFTVDAACASSLAAISMGVNELETGRSSMVLAGGVDTVQSPFGFLCFSKTQALSPTGQPKTFDKAADGIAISEGLAVVALKRLADAERDGDRIYAVIKAVSGSSDGKALGLTAPRPEGQVRALHRAYAKAGFSPTTLGLIEAHGTGTAVGDRAEAQTITGALAAESAAPKSVALGSVKTLIGHTKASAGVSGLIKVALSLYHRVLPAHYGVTQPIDTIADPQAATYLLKEPRPWLAHPDHPRRGGVSAFGFGGTNFHAVLEEHHSGGTVGQNRWPAELLLWRAADPAALTKTLTALRAALTPDTQIVLSELAFALAREASTRKQAAVTLAIVAGDCAGLAKDLDRVLAHLQDASQKLPPNIQLNTATPAEAPSVAFLFPGQGAQYLNMGREQALYVDELREAIELADRKLRDAFPNGLSHLMMPASAFDAETEAAQLQALTDTRVAQPAIGTLALGYLRWAQRLGLKPAATAGHSYGEYVALHAAGVFDTEALLQLSKVRGQAMAEASSTSPAGTMAAVQAPREQIAQLIEGIDGVKIANHNAPKQSVISGAREAVEQAVGVLTEAGLRAIMLPVSGAFHTELVASARVPLSAQIQATDFTAPHCAVYANSTGQPYPADLDAMRTQLDGHLLNSVEFVTEVEAMYAAGCRVFVELGPKGICSNMARQILAGKDMLAVSLDGGGSLRGTLQSLAELLGAGVGVDVLQLFSGRDLALMDLRQVAKLAHAPALPKHYWMISGGCARPLDDPEFRTGKLPALNHETAEAARQQAAAAMAQAAAAPAPGMPSGTPAAPMPAPTAASPLNNEAMVAYQQTMRQFLELQERVVQQFLGGASGPMPTMPAMPAPTAVSLPMPAPAPLPAPAPAAAPIAQAMTATPAAPVAVAVAPAAPAIDFKAVLLGIVADRTGYPEDMLALDADLEADLGIDSIKRVEILGAFQKALPGDLGGNVQGAMEQFTKARSLQAILDIVQAMAPTAPAVATVTVAAAPVAASPAIDFKAVLLGIVADRTGYPEDMLALDADLEADLGIDSIKRVEILGAFQKALPSDLGGNVQGAMEQFTKARSLQAILDTMGGLGATAAPVVAAIAPTGTAAPAVADTVSDSIPRYVIKPVPAPRAAASINLDGTALVLGAPDSIVTPLKAALSAAGTTPVFISETAPEALRTAVAAARQQYGAPRVLLHLHGLQAADISTLDQWRSAYHTALLTLFHTAQTLIADLPAMRVIAATRLGGTFGRDTQGAGSIAGGGTVGMLNCLRHEYPDAMMRSVDFDGQTDVQIASLLVQELRTEDAHPEIGYVGGDRFGGATVAEELVHGPFSPDLKPQGDWVALITGGARGITAEILCTLVEPGMRMVLLGRSAEPGAEAADTAALGDPQALRKALIAAEMGQGRKPKPAEIDRTLSRLLADREIRGNLKRLRDAGAVVDYVACDVRDADAFGQLIDKLYADHGRIDLVIHGAGIIEDKLLADKTAESFDRVLSTKLDPAFILSQKLRPESLKALSFFTSVAGRYGNRGQTDYAAANETLNRLAWDLQHRWPETRVVAVNWGPWDAGMASEGVKQAFRERGIEPIPVAAGCRMFREELERGPKHEVELVAGAGSWGVAAAEAPRSIVTADAAPTPSALPLLRGAARLGPGGHMLLDHVFSVESDPYLFDHRIDGKPVLPFAGALEWMAQFVTSAWPGWQVAEIRDMRQFNGIVLPENGELAVQIRARAASHSEANSQSVSVEIINPARKLPHYRATAILQQRLPTPQPMSVPTLDGTQAYSAEAAYSSLLFHGPRFQLVTDIGGVASGGLDAEVISTRPSEWLQQGEGHWLFDPGLIDVPPQMALVWGRVQHDVSALPARFGSVRRYGDAPFPQQLHLSFRVLAETDTTVTYDAMYLDDSGQVRIEMRDCESTLSAALNRLGGQAGPAVRRSPEAQS